MTKDEFLQKLEKLNLKLSENSHYSPDDFRAYKLILRGNDVLQTRIFFNVDVDDLDTALEETYGRLVQEIKELDALRLR